jgi:putative ATP-binding cassette transporter
MTQTARGFSSVEGALTFFITYYVSLAEFKAVLDRLTSFDGAIDEVRGAKAALTFSPAQDRLAIDQLTLRLPDGRPIVKDASFSLKVGEAALLTGPSGSGKSTLFRAISGIWPYGEGVIERPKGERIMLLPQKPYIPIGSLRAAVTYPAGADVFDETSIQAALQAANLPALAAQLDSEDNWSQRLSGGEQQRLAIARALLAKPDWLFLDEATAAMDENMEAHIYAMLFKMLPQTTIVSIGHRASLAQFHRRRIEMQPAGAGVFAPVELSARAAE